ncbi:MAG: nitroreductase [Verrucomicrobiales bacterium]|nr:nitroreductase [Verrucomicrobiales bacterium]
MSEDTPDVPLDPTSLRLAAASALIRRRRTIKPDQMNNVAVDKRFVAAILENANWAPSHGLTEPWRFTVFTGEAREDLAAYLRRLYVLKTSEEDFREDKLEKLGRNPLQADVAIVIGMKRQDSEKIPEVEEIEAVACAVQNMHLTASAIGLGGFWSTPPIVYTAEMTKFIELEPERDQCLGIFYLGWPEGSDSEAKPATPEEDTWPKGKRGPVVEKINWKD